LKKKRRLRTFAINIGLTALSVLICLVILEVALRVMSPYEVIDRGIRIREIGLPANSHIVERNSDGDVIDYRTNADGFRDREYSLKKKAGTYRIIGLGDSFIYGAGVELEDSCLKNLERLLNSNSKAGRRYEVLNLGMRAIGEKQMFELFKEIGARYQPDMVLLGFYIGNDFNDNMLYVRGKSIEEERQWGTPALPFRRQLRRYSKAIAFLANKWSDFRLNSGLARYGKEKLFMKDYPPDVLESLELTEGILQEMRDYFNRERIDFFVVIIPMKFQVDYNRKYEATKVAEGIVIDKPQSALISILERNEIPYLDLLPLFKERSENFNEDLYLSGNEIHWNSKGHGLAAQAIVSYLKSRNAI
jgi:hypothetical protein